MATTTNSITKSIIDYLNLSGYKAWRNNNNAVYSVKQEVFRKNPNTLKGIPDICGYRLKDGKALFVEVKTGKDTLSTYQQAFLNNAQDAGCIVFVAKTLDDFQSQFENFNL